MEEVRILCSTCGLNCTDKPMTTDNRGRYICLLCANEVCVECDGLGYYIRGEDEYACECTDNYDSDEEYEFQRDMQMLEDEQ